MDCQECGDALLFVPFHQRHTFNVYDIQCNLCRRYYCGLCGLSSHFPALCRERIMWDNYFLDRDANFLAIHNQMVTNTVARRTMEGWRNIIGPHVFDVHPHMRFAVEELSRVSNIHTWALVVARFSPPHAGLLLSQEFLRMTTAHRILYNQFTASMNDQAPNFELREARTALCLAAHRFLSFLRSSRSLQEIDYPPRFEQNMVDYSMNLDRALHMWILYLQR